MDDWASKTLEEAITQYVTSEDASARGIVTQLNVLGPRIRTERIVKAFKNSHTSTGQGALHKAARQGHQQLFNCLGQCLSREQQTDLYRTYEDSSREYPIHCAVKGEFTNIVALMAKTLSEISHYDIEYFLRCDDSNGQNPLHSAALNGSNDIMKILTGYLEFDEKLAVLQSQDKDGNTPLHLAATSEQLNSDLSILAAIEERENAAEEEEERRREEEYPDGHEEYVPEETPEIVQHHLISTMLYNLTPQIQGQLLNTRNFDQKLPLQLASESLNEHTASMLKEFAHSSSWYSWYRGINHNEQDFIRQRDIQDQRFSEIDGRIDRQSIAISENQARISEHQKENQDLKHENRLLREQIMKVKGRLSTLEQHKTVASANIIVHGALLSSTDDRLQQLDTQSNPRFNALAVAIQAQGVNITNTDELVDDHSTAIANMGERIYELEEETAENIDNVSNLQSLQQMTRKRACSDSVSDDTDTQKHPWVAP